MYKNHKILLKLTLYPNRNKETPLRKTTKSDRSYTRSRCPAVIAACSHLRGGPPRNTTSIGSFRCFFADYFGPQSRTSARGHMLQVKERRSKQWERVRGRTKSERGRGYWKRRSKWPRTKNRENQPRLRISSEARGIHERGRTSQEGRREPFLFIMLLFPRYSWNKRA